MKKYQILDNCSIWYRLISLEEVKIGSDGILYCRTISIINIEEDSDDYGNYPDFPVIGEDYPLILNDDDHELCVAQSPFATEEEAIKWFNDQVSEAIE